VKVTLVSHASLLVETRGVRILSDPWYDGRIYGGAWELAPAPPALPDFAGLDAIHLSHAHPDHFHVPTLKRLLPLAGAGVPVLVPKLPFPEMRDALHGLGFTDVREMAPGASFDLSGVRLYCQQFRFNDSFLVIQGDETLVNLNDCPVRGRTLAGIAERFPRIDYLFAQFSFAQALPHAYDPPPAEGGPADLVARLDGYARVLRPRHLVPFASFVRFCHQDNAYMNPHAITIADLRARSAAPLAILHPGDAIENGRIVDAPANRERYERALADRTSVASPSVPQEEMDPLLDAFVERLRRAIPGVLRRRIPVARLVFNDAPGGVRLDLARLRWERLAEAAFVTSPQEPLAYRLSTATLREAVTSKWGWSNLQIGAKFRARIQAGWEGRESWFWMLPMLGLEGYLDWRSLWFLRPRVLAVAWGRRTEALEYAGRIATGSFMSDVVRKKADYGATRPDESRP
jgi:hypothetical protein